MKNIIKALMVCLVLTVAFTMVTSAAIAQNWLVNGIYDVPEFFQMPLNVPSAINSGLLIDNFEYWDSPYNHGWVQVEPAYPTYGYGIGYATTFNTVLDLQEGSRVLDVYRPSSVFLLGPTPLYPYARHAIRYPCGGCMGDPTDANHIGVPLSTYPIFSFKFRAPLSIEWFDIFEFRLYYTCPANPYGNYIRIVPLQGPPCAGCGGGYNVVAEQNGVYTITIGREFLDGTWHVVYINIPQLFADAGISAPDVTRIFQLEASGQMFRLDEILFKEEFTHLCEPYLFKIGPRYAQFYEPYAFLFYADYRDFCGPSIVDILLMDGNNRLPNDAQYGGPLPLDQIFLTAEADINDYWAAQLLDEGITDPNDYLDPNGAQFLQAVEVDGREVVIIPGAPVFADPNRMAAILADSFGLGGTTNQTFLWNATVGGLGSSGVEFIDVYPLQINPADGMPTYIPVYGPDTTLAVASTFGQPFLGPNTVSALETALYYAGMDFWPGIGVLYYTPYVFEDLILTVEVSNGRTSDFETFPISVVNYPVENYPPYIEDVDDQFFPVGVQSFYAMSVVDPDNMIFSLATPPSTTHSALTPRTDMSQIVWNMTLNGLPSYSYGPWAQPLMNPINGVVSYNSQFEGAYTAIVTATDPFGASAVQSFTIFSVMPGTWLNHPPIILMDWDHPQVGRAGQEFILTSPNLRVIDPDGDELYFSSNLGAAGRDSNGNFIWQFTTNFPGFYTAEIIAYDIRGGYAIVTVDVEMKPWWSWSGF